MPRKKKTTRAPAGRKPGRRPRSQGVTQPLPGTEQDHDGVLERAFLDRQSAIDAAAKASEDKATAEATIQTRFEEIAQADPTDPRAKAYTVESGETLFPWKQPKLRIRRAPSRQAQAEDAVAANGSTKAAAPVGDDVPDLPDPEDLPDDRSAYQRDA
jgi:hypothetical protein